MGIGFSDEQLQFRDVVQRFLKEKSPPGEVRRLMEQDRGFDPAVWRQLCEELALAAIHIPEKYGGQGFGVVELGIVMEEMGRSLLCAPYFSSTVLAATAILNAASEQQKLQLLPQIASGSCIATLAVTEPNNRWDAEGVELLAMAQDDEFRLNGVKSYVLDGHIADLIVVVARRSGDNSLGFFTVDGDATGLKRSLLQTMDATRKQARLGFKDVPAKLLGDPDLAAAALAKTLDLAAIALANEMVGGAQQLLDTTIDYSGIRVQFGRTIGSFQAIKHKCADLLVAVELAKSAAYYAASAADEDADDLPAIASLAKSSAADAYMQAAKECKSSEVFLGDPGYHRELMLQRWQA
jgi:alkylation response protein AidB-like acyl-CoA dehydrogenase